MQAYIVAPQPPVVLLAAQLVADGERRGSTKICRDHHHSCLRGVRIDVHYDQQDLTWSLLGICDQPVVLGLEEGDVREALQRRAVAADLVEARDERQQRPVECAPLDLVLL